MHFYKPIKIVNDAVVKKVVEKNISSFKSKKTKKNKKGKYLLSQQFLIENKGKGRAFESDLRIQEKYYLNLSKAKRILKIISHNRKLIKLEKFLNGKPIIDIYIIYLCNSTV